MRFALTSSTVRVPFFLDAQEVSAPQIMAGLGELVRERVAMVNTSWRRVLNSRSRACAKPPKVDTGQRKLRCRHDAVYLGAQTFALFAAR